MRALTICLAPVEQKWGVYRIKGVSRTVKKKVKIKKS